MTDKADLIREIHEYVATQGGENTATHLLVQAASAIQTQAAELEAQLEAIGAGGVSGPLVGRAAPPTAQAEGWRPIETAPKDGTAILLGSRGGSWIGKWLPVYVSGYQPENPWSSLMLNHDHMGEKWCKPTHWMPLPEAPNA